MDIDIKATLRNALAALLRPIASIVMRGGMTWKEFADLSKTVFVSVATDEFGIRKANWMFTRDVLLLFRPGMIRSINETQKINRK